MRDARDLAADAPVVVADPLPPCKMRPGLGHLRRLRGAPPPRLDRRLATPGVLPTLCGYLLTSDDPPAALHGLPAFDHADKAPGNAVVVLQSDRWDRQVLHGLERGFTRFAAPPRRDLEASFRQVIRSREHCLVFVPNYKVMYSSFRDFMRDTFKEFADAARTTHALNRVEDLQTRAAARHFKFSMVRNPWDRLASAYRDKMCRGTEHPNHEQYVRPIAAVMGCGNVDFDTFTRYCAALPDSHADPHWFSCYSNLHAQGTCLVDFTGRIENVTDDVATIGERAGVRWELPVLNRTRGPGTAYRELYTSDEIIERVARRYRDDIDTYGYTF